MASLRESLEVDRSGYAYLEKKPTVSKAVNPIEPTLNTMIRCPLPPIAATPDTLRQFYVGAKVPQRRLLPPINSLNSPASNITNNSTTVINQSGGSTTSVSLAPKVASITTPTLNPNNTFLSSLQMAKSFQLLSVTANSPCRIELYGTALAQSLDESRPIDAAPAAGTFQNLISDVVLDSSPLQFYFQNRTGYNADTPQGASVYITVTNLDALSDIITVTFQYVAVEQP